MKILIADDEKTIRAGLVKIISEHFTLPLELLEAKNGQEAWDLVQQESPDILITDIRMPKMDGIELMRLVASLESKPAMVVLSGYDEFSYARESIRHGVVSYILKPVDKQEILQVLDRLVSERLSQQRQREEQLLASAMKGCVLEKDSLSGLIARDAYRIFKCVQPGSFELSSFLGQNNAYIVEERPQALVLLVPETKRLPVLHGIESKAAFAGLSDIIRTPADLQTCMTHADIASLARFFVSDRTFYLYEELADPAVHCSEGRTLDAVAVLIGTGDRPALDRNLQSLFDFESDSLFQNLTALYHILSQLPSLLAGFHQYTESDPYLAMKAMLLRDCDRYAALGDLKKDLGDFIIYLDITLKQRYSAYPFIEQALVYIAKHYTEDISMAVVANHCSVNYTYFSEKFKLVVGTNFNDYVKQLRLEEAKRLLQSGCYKVYEVASRAGFGDVKYFMKTFKEATGISPGEYQKRFIV
jgi:two-component system response regulator YesN